MSRSTKALFQLASGFYGWMTAQRAWREHCRRLVEALPPGPLTVVDLGCGPGVSTFEVARVRPEDVVVGLDFSPGMLREARRRELHSGLPKGRICWLRADAARLPFNDASVDVLTGHSFLYLLPDRTAALAECLRVLRPGGRLALMEPNQRPSGARVLAVSLDLRFLLSMLLWRPFSRFYGRFTVETLAQTLRAAGFEGVSTEETLGGMGLLGRAKRPAA